MINLKFKLGCLIAAGMIASTAHAEECGEVSLMKSLAQFSLWLESQVMMKR